MAIMMAEPHGKLQQTQFVGRRNKQKRVQGNTNGGSLSLGLVLDTGHRTISYPDSSPSWGPAGLQ